LKGQPLRDVEDDEDDDTPLFFHTEHRIETKKQKQKRKPGKSITDDKEDSKQTQEEEIDDPHAGLYVDGKLDMRSVYPIDEGDAVSNGVLALLSHSTQKLSRSLNETEGMEYVYVWLTMCHALNHVNSSEYYTHNMWFTSGRVATACFRYEIITRLHEVCHKTIQHAVDHVHGMLLGTKMQPVVVCRPSSMIAPIPFDTLCLLLQAQVEFCQLAIKLVHVPWIDFLDGRSEGVTDQDQAQLSSSHTATLGVLCSHMLQILGAIHRGHAKCKSYVQWLWESAVVVAASQHLLPYEEKYPLKVHLLRLSAQLQIIIYRLYVNEYGPKHDYAKAAYFTEKILAIIGATSQAEFDKNALKVYYTQIKQTKIDYISPEDLKPLAALQTYQERIHVSPVAIQTMAQNMLSKVYVVTLSRRGHVTPNFERVRLRYVKTGRIQVPENRTISQILDSA
jgi:hypothetical protein